MNCEYGCEQEAKFQFQNGKWCCSSSYTKCPGMKQKFISVNNKKTICKKCGRELSIANIKIHLESCSIAACLNCGNTIRKGRKFCGHVCAGKYNNAHSENLIDCVRGPHKLGRSYQFKSKRFRLVNICLNCGKIINSSKFCSAKCRADYVVNRKIVDWFLGELSGTVDSGSANFVKLWALRKYNHSCSICGWSHVNSYTTRIPLEIHHLDGDSENNRPENITILCPNCHSLTKTYKGANKDSKRTYRKKYYKLV